MYNWHRCIFHKQKGSYLSWTRGQTESTEARRAPDARMMRINPRNIAVSARSAERARAHTLALPSYFTMKNPTAGAEAAPFPALLSAGAKRHEGSGGREGVDAGHYKALQRVLLTFRVQSAPRFKIKHEMTRQRFARLSSLSNPSASNPPKSIRVLSRSRSPCPTRACLVTVCTIDRRHVFSPLGPRAEGFTIALCVAAFTGVFNLPPEEFGDIRARRICAGSATPLTGYDNLFDNWVIIKN